jgi:hypothetical protein
MDSEKSLSQKMEDNARSVVESAFIHGSAFLAKSGMWTTKDPRHTALLDTYVNAYIKMMIHSTETISRGKRETKSKEIINKANVVSSGQE